MRKPQLKPSFLQIIYVVMYCILFLVLIFTPALISGPVRLSRKPIVTEDFIEGAIAGVLFLISLVISKLYEDELKRNKELAEKISLDKRKVEERLTISDQYIGTINVQIQEIKSIFTNIEKYPESRAELKKVFHHLGERVLVIVNSNWVLLRIVNQATQRTLIEHFGIREGFPCSYPHISNKTVLESRSVSPYSAVISMPVNLKVSAFCVMPVAQITQDQKVFLQAIINEITKLFLIMESSWYQDVPVNRKSEFGNAI